MKKNNTLKVKLKEEKQLIFTKNIPNTKQITSLVFFSQFKLENNVK